MNSDLNIINGLIAKMLGCSPGELSAYIAERQANARRRAEQKNRRYAEALRHMTDVQAVVIDRLEAQGYVANERIWQNRATGNICQTLSKKMWDTMKGKMGTKLITVYPDGTTNQTFEKTISIRQNF